MIKELYFFEELTLNEAFDRTVVNMHLYREKAENGTFIFCGCEPKVGTTALSINLAIAFANSGWKTVLIDTDMRKGQANKRLPDATAQEDFRHLAGYLAGDVALNDILTKTNHDNLMYITSGDPLLNPIQMLSSARLRQLFESLKSTFDFVIVDAPASSSVADTCILAQQAQNVILVAQWDKTTVEHIQKTKDEIESSGATIAGIIINRMGTEYYNHYMDRRPKSPEYRLIQWDIRKSKRKRGRDDDAAVIDK